jgi:alkanesulfonate monooxygenase SsuD/methylene tetrahydromethanopterin reductase-like flavin-dependent oxidoreductase (luciferase family)
MDHLHPPGMPELPSFEGWTLAAALAPLTNRIRLGHLVLANSFRHPALLAKMVASLDVISGGRLDLGLGSGSYEPEHAMYGFAWETAAVRARRLGEALEVVTRLLRSDRASFDGEYYRLREAVNRPPPVQKPAPPIWVGGAGERYTLPLVARYADGWNCPTYALADFAAKRRALATECERIGRDPDTLRISIEAVLALARDEKALEGARPLAEKRFGGPGWGLREGGFIGTPATVAARIRELASAGVDHFVFFFWDRLSAESLELFTREVIPAARQRA